MSRERTTERVNPRSRGVDLLDALGIVRLMSAEDRGPQRAVAAVLPEIARAVEAIARRLARGGRLFYVGAGTSGRLGVLDASECPPTFDSDPAQVQALMAGGPRALVEAVEGAEDSAPAGAADLRARRLSRLDAVVGISASGRTPYVAGALDEARRVGAARILLACVERPELASRATVRLLPVVGPEVVAGSTRLKAGTATKMVLNMLSTATMIRLGKVYDNLMVDVRATNEKLRDRACRLVERLTPAGRKESLGLLERAGWRVKTAVVMRRLGLGRREAERALAGAKGFLRQALATAEGTVPRCARRNGT